MEHIDLKDYLKRLLDNWFIIVLCCIVGGVSAFVYSKFVATPVYSSTVKIGVYNSDWSNKNSTISEIQASLGLIETCTVVLRDDVTAEAVSQSLEESADIDISAKSVKSAVTISQIDDSQWLQVEARADDPQLAAAICNAVAANAPKLIAESVANIEIKRLGEAKVNNTPVSPNTTRNVIIVFLATLLLACFVVFLFEFFDNTIRDESKLMDKYGLGILGVVPDISESGKNYKNYRGYKSSKSSYPTAE